MKSVAIGIGTRNRPKMLKRAVESIIESNKIDHFKIKIFICDNSEDGNALKTVDQLKKLSATPIQYDIFSKIGIPFVRNHLLKQALLQNFDALIYFDDDEFFDSGCLFHHISYIFKHYDKIAAVQGPVLAQFEVNPPEWLPTKLYSYIKGNFTGDELRVAATNNVILNLQTIKKEGLFFDESMAFTGSSDTEFFRRLKRLGHSIHWCNEAIAYEHIPPSRMSFNWLSLRYFRRGCSKAVILKKENGSFWGSTLALGKGLKIFLFNILKLFKISQNQSYYVEKVIWLFSGLGLIAGTFGVTYKEYKKTHGY